MNGALFVIFAVMAVRLSLILYGHHANWVSGVLVALLPYVAAGVCGYYLEAMLKAIFGSRGR